MQAHEIDYQIFGEEMQYVEIELDPQEIVIAEAGSFMMMDNNIQMQTIFGDGSQQQIRNLRQTPQRRKTCPYWRKFVYDCIYQSKQFQKQSIVCLPLSRKNPSY